MRSLFFLLLLYGTASLADTKSEALTLFAKRDDEIRLRQSLALFEKAAAEKTQDEEVLTFLARGYFILGENHLLKDEEKKQAFETAQSFGEKVFELRPSYREEVKRDRRKAIQSLTEKEAPALFWTACALGKWAKVNGIMSSLKYQDQIVQMVKKVEELRPDYYYASVPRYWGTYYAVVPRIAGGDMKKSEKEFFKAMTIAPEFLATKRLFAEYWLTEKGDEKAFRKALQEILDAPEGGEDIAPENRMEKKEARRLLQKIDELF